MKHFGETYFVITVKVTNIQGLTHSVENIGLMCLKEI